ncbi:MAG: hypothetical protein EZS28_048916, partial [Streblomastix strix]
VEPGSEISKDSPGIQLFNGDIISIGILLIIFSIRDDKLEDSIQDDTNNNRMVYSLQEYVQIDTQNTKFKFGWDIINTRQEYERLRIAYKFSQIGVGQDMNALI